MPFAWFAVNMGAWAAGGYSLWHYMKALGDAADDVLLLQLAPLNQRLLSLGNLERCASTPPAHPPIPTARNSRQNT